MSDATDLAVWRVAQNEGFRADPYNDTDGNLTIGYGCKCAGWSVWLAHTVLVAQLEEHENNLEPLPWYNALDATRQSVLVEMDFNLGHQGLMQFTRMLAAVEAKDWQTAHDEMLNSKWATQVKGRAVELANLMLNGAAT